MPLDLSKAPDQPKFTPKKPMGAGGSFDIPLQESLENKLIKHPNLYGAYGAVVGTAEELTKYSWLKYIYPEEREKFNKLTTQQQTRQLLMDDLEAVAGLGFSRIVSPLARIGGHYLKQWLPATYKVLTSPLGRKATKPLRKALDEGAKVMDMIGERRANIDVGMLKSTAFINQFERNLTKKELESIPFIREGIKDPKVLEKIGRKDLIPFVENPSPKILKVTEKIGKYYDDSHKFLQQHWDDISFVEDYVTHIWDIPKNKQKEVVNYFATKNPFLKKRSIPTLEEGIKLGLKPKTTNIADLLRVYDQYKIKTAYNFNLANQLKNAVSEEGAPLVMRIDKAPSDWITINHPALNRTMMTGKTVDVPILSKVPVKVDPRIAKEVKIIFDEPFSHPAIHVMEIVNAFTKKSMLSVSFFHHVALTESAFSSGIGRKAITLWSPPKIYKALKNKDFAIFSEQKLAEDAIRNGRVTFGALEDVQRNIVQKSLQTLERRTKKIPGLNLMTK